MMLDHDHSQGDTSRRPEAKALWIFSLALVRGAYPSQMNLSDPSDRVEELQCSRCCWTPHTSMTNYQEQERQSFTNTWRCPASSVQLHQKQDSYFTELGEDHQICQIASEKVHIQAYSALPITSPLGFRQAIPNVEVLHQPSRIAPEGAFSKRQLCGLVFFFFEKLSLLHPRNFFHSEDILLKK